ncbi:MAG: arylsulfatase [Betaproteobacteria bacterium]|nr:arylsulfatase [Betaproteobacteria bacterium]MDH5285900.1 arylsulfatase [Betaproteobacteria bacterium]
MLRQAVNRIAALACASALALAATAAHAQAKPNILVMFGDDVGYWNVSAYNRGQMGYRTPNIDRIAKEGALFTDAYAQQSCTAGRAAFITGQSPMRTGLTKVGLPGAPEGLSAKDPTLAELLKAQGYMTAQFGKNHLGDRNEFFPTVHGFDEFMGNFYHLNAEEEPENEDYPKNPEFKAKFGPRGVFKCVATTTVSTLPDDPRFGKWGKQKCEDTGPLNRKRMETIDYEVTDASMDFMSRATKAGKPFFLWFNTSRMHIWTHLRPESKGKTGLGVYPDGMVEHDNHIGMMLKKLEDLGIANNTIVIWTTDNGAEVMSWPDGGTTPFRGEKNTNWEGGYRVPFVMRWPGVIQPGTEINEIVSHEDWLPTLMAAVGQPNVKDQLKAGATIGGVPYKVHVDGYNLMPALKGETKEWPRKEFLYWTDDGNLAGLRYQQYKIAFLEQRAHGFDVWEEPMVPLRLPKLFNLRSDPFERADHEGMGYQRWRIDRAFVLVPAQTYVGQWLTSFKDFPPRQKPGSFSIGDAMEKLSKPSSN